MTETSPGELLLLLTRQGVPLGRLWVRGQTSLGVRCRFEAMPAFNAYRELFEEENRLAERLKEDDSPQAFKQAEAALDRIQALELRLRGEGGSVKRRFLIGIHGEQASLQLLPEGAEAAQ